MAPPRTRRHPAFLGGGGRAMPSRSRNAIMRLPDAGTKMRLRIASTWPPLVPTLSVARVARRRWTRKQAQWRPSAPGRMTQADQLVGSELGIATDEASSNSLAHFSLRRLAPMKRQRGNELEADQMIESRPRPICPHCSAQAPPMLILYSNRASGEPTTWSCRECGREWPDPGRSSGRTSQTQATS